MCASTDCRRPADGERTGRERGQPPDSVAFARYGDLPERRWARNAGLCAVGGKLSSRTRRSRLAAVLECFEGAVASGLMRPERLVLVTDVAGVQDVEAACLDMHVRCIDVAAENAPSLLHDAFSE